jgi:hypothetical protein
VNYLYVRTVVLYMKTRLHCMNLIKTALHMQIMSFLTRTQLLGKREFVTWLGKGRAIAQAVSRRLPTAAVRVRAQIR